MNQSGYHGNRRLTLCFHGIGDPARELEPGEAHVWITRNQFENIVRAVRDHPRPVEITFDDSNESDYAEARPVLERFGMSAEFFVIVGRIDTPGSLSSEQIRRMSDVGLEIGSHGMRHVRWRELSSDEEVHEELYEAAGRLAEIIGRPVRHAACPNGSYDRRVLRMLRTAGYSRVYSVDGGTSRPSSWLRSRYTVTEADSGASITALMNRPDGTNGEFLMSSVKRLVKKWR